MQKKLTGFLIATLAFNVAVLFTVYFSELFSREISFIWSWLLFVVIALGAGSLIANIINKLKLNPQVGVFAFFWSIVFAVLVRFYYHNYSTLTHARIAEPMEVTNAIKVRKKYDYFRFKNYKIDKQSIGYQLVKDSLVEKSDPKKGTFHYYVAPLISNTAAKNAPTIFVGKHYIGIEPNYKDMFKKRLDRKDVFYREYSSSYTFAGAVKTVNPTLKKAQNYLLLKPALSPYDQQKGSWQHLLILLIGGNILWSIIIFIILMVKKKNDQPQTA